MSINFWDLVFSGLIVAGFTAIMSSIRQYTKEQKIERGIQNETNTGFLKALQDLTRQLEVAITHMNDRDASQQQLCAIHNNETCNLKKDLSTSISKLNVKIDNNAQRITIIETQLK